MKDGLAKEKQSLKAATQVKEIKVWTRKES